MRLGLNPADSFVFTRFFKVVFFVVKTQLPQTAILCLTPSLPQTVKSPGWKVHRYSPENSMLDGPVTNLLSILCILLEILSPSHWKIGKSRNDFKFGSFVGRFPSNTLASMTMIGLITCFCVFCFVVVVYQCFVVDVMCFAPIRPNRVTCSSNPNDVTAT